MDEPEWTDLLDVADMPAGAIRAVEADDLDLVVWRGTSGETCVMEARCPHQWSHLEAEGVVDGDEIVCTAHFWRFTRQGRGTKLNVKGRRDVKADIAVYPSREVGGRLQATLTSDGDLSA
jgi:nitrite reductase/ring-hydroxylating ferredoxin subunit